MWWGSCQPAGRRLNPGERSRRRRRGEAFFSADTLIETRGQPWNKSSEEAERKKKAAPVVYFVETKRKSHLWKKVIEPCFVWSWMAVSKYGWKCTVSFTDFNCGKFGQNKKKKKLLTADQMRAERPARQLPNNTSLLTHRRTSFHLKWNNSSFHKSPFTSGRGGEILCQ